MSTTNVNFTVSTTETTEDGKTEDVFNEVVVTVSTKSWRNQKGSESQKATKVWEGFGEEGTVTSFTVEHF